MNKFVVKDVIINENKITLSSSKIAEQNAELFEILETMPDAMQRLDAFLNEKDNEWYNTMGINNDTLKEDLYKVRHYVWVETETTHWINIS